MESGVTAQRAKGGFILVTVLIIAAVGLLFGAGSLLLFRYQCQLRIDRQHELEKLYSVRSVLNYIKTYDVFKFPESGKSFLYCTGSDRDLGLLAKPADRVFPNPTNDYHLIISQKESNFKGEIHQSYDTPITYDKPDYVCGAQGVTNLWISNITDGQFGLVFPDITATNNVKWWVNVGMPGTGGWLQESYGRRYYFRPRKYVKSGITNDIMRLCIIREPTNGQNTVGRGWPLSSGERAIVFEICTSGGDSNKGSADTVNMSNAKMSLFDIYNNNGFFVTNHYHQPRTDCPSICFMGVQIAGNMISSFYVDPTLKSGADESEWDKMGGYSFSDAVPLKEETYNYFMGGCEVVKGEILKAPDLRAVFEVEAAADGRQTQIGHSDFLTDFRVTKGYQYDVFLEHPNAVTNLATVAQKIGEYLRGGLNYTVLTYDTHGTEHKGFRKDEREAERKGGR